MDHLIFCVAVLLVFKISTFEWKQPKICHRILRAIKNLHEEKKKKNIPDLDPSPASSSNMEGRNNSNLYTLGQRKKEERQCFSPYLNET